MAKPPKKQNSTPARVSSRYDKQEQRKDTIAQTPPEPPASIAMAGPVRSGVFCLRAETPLHAGAGTGSGTIDLPVQREAHTDWPYLAASGLKSAMRDAARVALTAQPASGTPEEIAAAEEVITDKINSVFGSDTNGDKPGSVAIGEASILLLPVRSLTGHFKWVTAPAVLERHLAMCARVGVKCLFSSIPKIGDENGAAQMMHATHGVFLEEFHFSVAPAPGLDPICEHLAAISGIAPAALRQRLVLVHDDRFAHFAKYATPKAAHVKLTPQKTVAFGPWYEETLAPDTVLALPVQGLPSSPPADQRSAGVSYKFLREWFSVPNRPYLRVGGNETLGMGWCKVNVTDATP